MKFGGSDVDVTAGTGFRGGNPVPLVRLTVTNADGEAVAVWIRPLQARAIGLDLIGAQRTLTTDELGPG